MPEEEPASPDTLNPEEGTQPTYKVLEIHLAASMDHEEDGRSIGIIAPEGQKWIGAILLAEDHDGQLSQHTVDFRK